MENLDFTKVRPATRMTFAKYIGIAILITILICELV